MKAIARLIRAAQRILLALRVHSTERDIRRTLTDAQHHPERAAYYRGELLPALSLRLIALRQAQRAQHQPAPPARITAIRNMPALGQPWPSHRQAGFIRPHLITDIILITAILLAMVGAAKLCVDILWWLMEALR
jgi:hypothetical protein